MDAEPAALAARVHAIVSTDSGPRQPPDERPFWLPPEQPVAAPPEAPVAYASPPPAAYPYETPWTGTPPAPRRGLSRMTAILVIVGILAGPPVLYGVVGYALAAIRIAGADSALSLAIAHGTDLKPTINSIDSGFGGVNSANLNARQAKALVDQFVATAQQEQTTTIDDISSLESSRASFGDQQWLTAMSRGRMDVESNRIGHALTALAAAKSITTDYMQDGQFLQAFFNAVINLDTLSTDAQNKDLKGALATVVTMKENVDLALQLSAAPGLPGEVHQLMVDFQVVAIDFGNVLNAAAAGDTNAANADLAKLRADTAKLQTFNGTAVSAKIDAFYKPMIDTFDSEMAKAGT
jgi:hypothetical protein